MPRCTGLRSQFSYFSITGDPRLKLAEINGSLASSMAEIEADA